MGFTDTGIADENNVFVSVEKGQMEEMLNLHPVNLLWIGPLKVIKGFYKREVGVFDPALNSSFESIVGLSMDQFIEKIDRG